MSSSQNELVDDPDVEIGEKVILAKLHPSDIFNGQGLEGDVFRKSYRGYYNKMDSNIGTPFYFMHSDDYPKFKRVDKNVDS